MTIIGTAEVLVTADTSKFNESIKSGTDPALAGIAADAEGAGADAGSALRKGVEGETGKLEGDLTAAGEKGGKGLSGGLGKGAGLITGLLGQIGIPLGPLGEGFTKAGEAAGTADHKAGGFLGTMSKIGGGVVLGAGVAIAGAVVEGLKLGKAMQTADASIAVSSGQSVKAATAIGNAFLSTAGSTEFSGQEMATAYGQVAGQLKVLNGHALNATQATGFMNTAMDLATAKQIPLATATAALTSTMQAYQVPVKDAAAASDVLFNASNATGQGVDVLTQSLQRMKARMGANAPSLQESAGLLEDMTKQGISGQMAMRGLSTGLASVTGPSKSVAKEAEALGLSVYDASGKFVGIKSVIEQLGPKFAGMTEQQRSAAATALFGASAASQLTAVINAGPAAYDKATASVGKLGAAHAGAEKQSATLVTETKTLQAGFDDLETKIGQFLIPIIQKVGHAILTASNFFLKHKVILEALALVIGGILVSALAAYVIAMAPAIGATILAAAPVVAIGLAIAAVVAAVILLYTNWTTIWNAVKNFTLGIVNDVIGFFKGLPSEIIGFFESLPGDFLKLGGELVKMLIHGIGDLGSAIGSVVKGAVSHIPLVGGFLSKLATGGIVTKPTIALVGEAGPEAVIPLSGMPASVMQGGGVQELGSALAGPGASAVMSSAPATASGASSGGGVTLSMPITFTGVTDVGEIVAQMQGAVGAGFQAVQTQLQTGNRPGTPT